MLAPFPDWNPELLERHAEALDLLWLQRAGAWRAPAFTAGTLARHDARIAAHADALVIAADAAWWLVEARLLGDHLAAATGAAHVLLLRDDADGRARAAAALDAGLALDAFAVALRHGPLAPHREVVERLARGRAERPAAAALAALAFHGEDAGQGRLVDLVQSGEAPVRSRAWEAVAFLGEKLWASQLSGVRAALDQAFRAAVVDPDAAVRTEALEAAAWTRQPWLLALLRERVDPAGPDGLPALRLLATLGGPEDLPALRAAAANPKLGPSRMALLGALGHPDGVPDLLAALTSFEPPVAAGAAQAFRALTGIPVDGPRRLPARPWDRDEEEDDLAETFPVPDVPKARRAWADLAPRVGAAARLAGGLDVTAGVPPDAWAQLDLESTWALRLRDAFTRRAPCRRAELEALRGDA